MAPFNKMERKTALDIHVTGLVQGVGFRPFVYRLAVSNQIYGWVENNNDGVRIHAEGFAGDLEAFRAQLVNEAPRASQVRGINSAISTFEGFSGFEIRKSSDLSDEITEISPDIAVCQDCLEDMKRQENRYNYPFINCTNCGPRFSIIKGVPYDRPKTTMEPFRMCPECCSEYTDVLDRRFHAQPVACWHCGPRYTYHPAGSVVENPGEILNVLATDLGNGKIIAIKGIGGFHLACDATDETTVRRLRQRKIREGKPFAVMFRDLRTLRSYMEVSQAEEQALTSWQRPIVILKNKKTGKSLAPAVSNSFETTGVMLPYMPVHYLVFERVKLPAIVLTSGNLSDEPVIISNEEALSCLNKVADSFLVYNRNIYNRTDDSVLFMDSDKTRMIRRSRGFAPSPVHLPMDVDGIFAAGAELVNCFCVGKGKKAFLSQHIGDLKNLETLEFYRESHSRFLDMFRIKASLVACDLHPDYLSTRFAHDFAKEKGNIPLVGIQHHHAHLAACMAEHGIDEKVIGIALDGVGYGTDGNIWGFEVFICDEVDFERKIHLEYIPQPGGDKANHEPWRMAVSYLYHSIGADFDEEILPFSRKIGREKIDVIRTAIRNNINCPLTSSAGRLFDAVSALTGLCSESMFHAEAPMRLEDCLDPDEKGRYDYSIENNINISDMFRAILDDIRKGTPASRISARFHRTVVDMLLRSSLTVRSESGINKVVLSGGTFQNRFLLKETARTLNSHGFTCCFPEMIPANDGGIALGQLVIASARRKKMFIPDL